MIKLAPIVKKILYEAKRRSGTYTYTFEFDDLHIPSLCRLSDIVEIELNVNYNYHAGSPGTHEDPPESPEVDISDWDTESVIVIDEAGRKRSVDLGFLHPMAKKALYAVIENQLEKNDDSIKRSIMNGGVE